MICCDLLEDTCSMIIFKQLYMYTHTCVCVSLCVYIVYIEYMLRTKTRRKNHSNLLLSYIKSYQPITRDTVSRWIKTILARAKIDTSIYKAQSVRSASVFKRGKKFLVTTVTYNDKNFYLKD